MALSVTPCPSCKSLLLSDTNQCPTCGHVVTKKTTAEENPSTPQQPKRESEVACGNCGEMVRVGVVRCWNCKSFMREDIAKMYDSMQASERPVIYSQLPEGETQAPFMAGDDDFELTGDSGYPEADGIDYTLNAQDAVPQTPTQQQMASQADQESGQLSNPEIKVPEAQPQAEEKPQKEAPQPTAEAPTPDQAPEKKKKRRRKQKATEADSDVHSEATGGEALLNIALQEEKEGKRKRVQNRAPKYKDGFFIRCSNVRCNVMVEVQERHRGKIGRCPKCRSPFLVPMESGEPEPETTVTEQELPEGAVSAGKFQYWLEDVALHKVDPSKLKIKPGSLEKLSEPVDIGFSAESLLVVTLIKMKPGTLFAGSSDGKREAFREELYETLEATKERDKLPSELPVFDHDLIAAEETEQLKIVQPAPYAHESMFAGVPVFGEGRIAVRLPLAGDKNEQLFLSFHLSSFREFSRLLGEHTEVKNFGQELGIPLEEQYSELACHYSEQKLPVIEDVEYYHADPEIQVALIGFRCESCRIVVGEDARRKEKIGPKSGKGMAKVKCPKCKAVFGDQPLYTLQEKVEEASAQMG